MSNPNSNVIDNENITLLSELEHYLPDTTRASIAVGYFFISGFAKIMNSLQKIEDSDNPDHKIRLLISPTTNRLTAEALLASNESMDAVKAMSMKSYPNDEGKKIAKEQVKKTLEYMQQTDQDHQAVVKLIELIKKEKLEVKVYTESQLHAKAYILEYMAKRPEKVAFVGSSNLSISGVQEHTELNLKTTHPADPVDLLNWFDKHWNDISCTEFTKEIADVMDKSWAGKERTPNEVYVKAVSHEHGEFFKDVEISDTRHRQLFDFQKVAVNDALKKLDKSSGVIIADVVGTGKSFIGSAVLRYLRDSYNSRPLIICPPHLEEMWRDYMNDFNMDCPIVSRYKIGDDDCILSRYTNCNIILVDESHGFRNSNTNAYKALLSFIEEKTEEAKVILLSATPISNRMADLKNQLRLFPQEGLLQIPVLSNGDLAEYFKGMEDNGVLTDDGKIKAQELLKYVLIRRTRAVIKKRYARYDEQNKLYYLDHKDGRKYFPNRKLQNPTEYDIDKVYNNHFDDIIECLKQLKMTRYDPGKYIKEKYLDPMHAKYKKYQELHSSSLPLRGIVKSSLIKRMESSIQAFRDSISNYKKSHEEFRRLLNTGTVPIGKEFQDEIYRKVVDSGHDYDDEYDENLSNIKSQYDIDAFDVDSWKADMQDDIDLFEKISGYILNYKKYTEHDDKLHILIKLLEQRPSDKIIIFSESASTVQYISNYLKTPNIQKKLKNKVVEEIYSDRNIKKKDIIWRFDPDNNPGPTDMPDKPINILVSTDVLSEGVNLQTSRVVINYDFHWNPVKLIQRIGRVDRIGTKHKEIEIINFLLTTKSDEHITLTEKVSNKIAMIQGLIGGAQQIFMPSDNGDEGTTEFIDKDAAETIYSGDFDDLDGTEEEGILNIPEAPSEKIALDIKKDEKRIQEIQEIPYGIRSSVGEGKLLVACEANETISDQSENEIANKIFRKYYEITIDGIRPIWQSTFLKQIGDHSNLSFTTASKHNEYIKKGWERFSRDMDNSVAKKSMLTHQKFFEKKLRTIAVKHKDERILSLLVFIGQRMISNRQPYKALSYLRKKIDHDINMTDDKIINELEEIHVKFKDVRYNKRISKPRILYSLMVSL